MERKRPSLEEVFSPRGIVVVGASSTNMALRGLMEAGFPTLYPVNPKYTEVLGLPCYPNLRAIPGVVDHVETFITAESVLALLDDCAAKGIKSIRFYQKHGFHLLADKDKLLRTYWEIPERQIENSVVLGIALKASEKPNHNV